MKPRKLNAAFTQIPSQSAINIFAQQFAVRLTLKQIGLGPPAPVETVLIRRVPGPSSSAMFCSKTLK